MIDQMTGQGAFSLGPDRVINICAEWHSAGAIAPSTRRGFPPVEDFWFDALEKVDRHHREGSF